MLGTRRRFGLGHTAGSRVVLSATLVAAVGCGQPSDQELRTSAAAGYQQLLKDSQCGNGFPCDVQQLANGLAKITFPSDMHDDVNALVRAAIALPPTALPCTSSYCLSNPYPGQAAPQADLAQYRKADAVVRHDLSLPLPP